MDTRSQPFDVLACLGLAQKRSKMCNCVWQDLLRIASVASLTSQLLHMPYNSLASKVNKSVTAPPTKRSALPGVMAKGYGTKLSCRL